MTHGAVRRSARQETQVRQPQVHALGARHGLEQPPPHLKQRELQGGRVHPAGLRPKKRGRERRESSPVALLVVARPAVPPRGGDRRRRDALSGVRKAGEGVLEEAIVAGHRCLQDPPPLDARDDSSPRSSSSFASSSSSSATAAASGSDDLREPPPGPVPSSLVGLEAVGVLPPVHGHAGPAGGDDADFCQGD